MPSDSPTSTIDKNHFVPPINNLKRVQSLQSRKSSVSDDRPLPRKDGYIGRWTIARLLSVTFGAVLVTISLYTLGLVFAVAIKHGKPEDFNKNSRVNRTLRIVSLWVTVTPILFATIMGRLFRKLALYQAQKGVTIGNLERLLGCQSIYTALQTQVSIRPFGFIGLLIILLWLFPPFASQAFLRLVDFSDTYVTSAGTAKYLHLIQAAQDTVRIIPDDVSMPRSRQLLSSAVFFQIALLMSSYISSPRDYKAYVKIPSVHSLTPGSGSWDPTEWRQIDDSRPIAYSSLMGIPVAGLSHDANTTTTFQLPSRHWAVDCSHIGSSTLDQKEFNNTYSWTHQAFVMDLAVPDNMTASQSSWPIRLVSLRGDPKADAFEDQVSGAQNNMVPLPKAPINLAYCSIGAQNVVSNLSCIQTDCEVNSMLLLNDVQSSGSDSSVQYLSSINVEDQSLDCTESACTRPKSTDKDVWNPALWDWDAKDGMPQGDPNLDLPSAGTPVQGLRMVLQTLALASVIQEDRFPNLETNGIAPAYARYVNGIGATNAELWLAGDGAGYVSSQYSPWPDYASVPTADFAARLETLVNTWWQAFFMPPYLEADLLDGPLFDAANRLVFRKGDPGTPFNDTATSVHAPGPRLYRCRWPYVFVVLVTSSVMVIAAATTLVLEFLIIAPNILGFASTYTRDNAHVLDCAGGSHMGGFQRAGALCGVKVRIGDVSSREAVGHISLTTDLSARTALRKERQYD